MCVFSFTGSVYIGTIVHACAWVLGCGFCMVSLFLLTSPRPCGGEVIVLSSTRPYIRVRLLDRVRAI